MPCYKPIEAWYSKDINEATGKRSLVFRESDGDGYPIEIACGQCIGCRLERSRQWAMRCVYEAQTNDENCFITLTYSDEFLPASGSTVKKHLQDFWKRLRKHIVGRKIKYFACSEYGDISNRPHYHACVFGYDFPDKSLYSVRDGVRLYVSESLNKIWGMGYCTIGEVTFESAAYVARYVMKKITGDDAKEHYTRFDSETGETWEVEPERAYMSNGIAKEWFKLYRNDLEKGFLTLRGKKMKPPKYFETLLEQEDTWLLEDMKDARQKAGLLHLDDNTRERLDTREQIKSNQIKRLTRKEI